MLRNTPVTLAALVAASALVLAACGGSSGATTSGQPSNAPAASSSTQPGATQADAGAIVVQVKNGEPIGGTKEVSVKHGDTVNLRVEVDAPQELHLHGYDIEKEAAPGQPAVFVFTANLEGIFDLESHLTDAKLAKLTVNP